MSELGMEDSITEESPLFQTYLQELQQIFREDDSAILKAAILKYQIWDCIVEALLNEDEKKKLIEEEEARMEEENENNNANNNQNQILPNYGFSTKATSYDNKCRLYLPQSLISVDMDLSLFGSFDTDEKFSNFQEPYYQQQQQIPQMMAPPPQMMSQIPNRSNNMY